VKLVLDVKVPANYDRSRIQDIVRQLQTAVNQMAECRIDTHYLSATSAPSSGAYKRGDFVPNSAPSELGGGGSKYVITGWICTDDSPLTFVACRSLTGN
jgi:hypothetical protein